MNRKMTTVVRLWEEKEGVAKCKNQIRRCRQHRYKEGREDLTIATPGRDTLTQILLRTRTCSWQMYDCQLEREVAQHRMWWKMMEEEWL